MSRTPTPYGRADEIALENARLRQALRDEKRRAQAAAVWAARWKETARALLHARDAFRTALRAHRWHLLTDPRSQCPTCTAPAHRDMAGIYWTTANAEAADANQRLRAELHRIEDQARNSVWRQHGGAPFPGVITVEKALALLDDRDDR